MKRDRKPAASRECGPLEPLSVLSQDPCLWWWRLDGQTVTDNRPDSDGGGQ